ncbi:MAG: hypothetical protein J6W75_07920 [Bacteroidaceae bacterium]|nr:hypothetical protein [Bacteroidaceae bacterium]
MNTKLILKRPIHLAHEARREKESVRRLLTFERFARDNQLWDEMMTCYSADAQVHASWFEGTAQAFANALAARTDHIPYHIHSTLVWTLSNRAVAIMDTTFQVKVDIDGHLLNQTADSQYIYRLLRINGEWFIHDCRTILEELPGKNRPDYIKELYAEADNWLLNG